MRTLTSTLTANQKAMGKFLAKIVLTKTGQTTQTYTTTRIKYISPHTEQPYSQTAEVLLDNSDGALTSLDLQGYKGVISYGYTDPTAGDEYSARAPLWVIAQQLLSYQGGLVCSLSLAGTPNFLKEDRASAAYTPDSTSTSTVKALISDIGTKAGAITTVFSHCKAYTVTFDSEDALIDVFAPADSFRIPKNSTRLDAIKTLLGYTGCVMRVEADEAIHIFIPRTTTSTAWVANTAYSLNDMRVPTVANDYEYICTTAGTSGATEPTWPTTIGATVTDGTVVWTVAYHYEYSLASGEHTFFNKAYRKRIVIPGYITVASRDGDATPYSGIYDGSQAIEVRDFRELRLASDAQAVAIATAIYFHNAWDAEKGSGQVPLNVGAEVHDFVKMTDSRQSDWRAGNIGHLTTHYRPGDPRQMDFGFGSVDYGGLVDTMPPQASQAAATPQVSLARNLNNLVNMFAQTSRNFDWAIMALLTRIQGLESNNIVEGIFTVRGDAPEIRLHETDQTDPAGRYRFYGAGGGFALSKAKTANWATEEAILTISTLNKRIDFGAGALPADWYLSLTSDGPRIYMFGGSHVTNPNLFRLDTESGTPGSYSVRLQISGGLTNAVATWTGISHSGLELNETLYASDGAIKTTGQVGLNLSGTALAMTLANPTSVGKILVIVQRDSGTAGHTVTTATAGGFDGINNTATFNAIHETLVLISVSSTRWVIVQNIGAVALSAV